MVELVGDESLEVEDLVLFSEDSDGFVVDDLGHSLDLGQWRSCVGDTAVEDFEWGREGLADGFRIGAEGLDLVFSAM